MSPILYSKLAGLVMKLVSGGRECLTGALSVQEVQYDHRVHLTNFTTLIKRRWLEFLSQINQGLRGLVVKIKPVLE